MENPECNLYRIQTVYKNQIYFTDAAWGVYSVNLDFNGMKHLFDASFGIDIFITDDRIVYADNNRTETLGDNLSHAVDIFSRPLSDISHPELLLSNVYVGMNYRDKFYYYLTDIRLFGDTFDEGTNVLYEYSFADGESRVIYDIGEREVSRIYKAFSDKYIVLTECDYSNETVKNNEYLILHNIATGDETRIPY